MKTIENDTVCTTAAMRSLTWLSAAMVATYKREHVVNIGKLTMNTYFLKRHVLVPLGLLLTLNTNITFCWLIVCLKYKSTTLNGPAIFGRALLSENFRSVTKLRVLSGGRYFRNCTADVPT